MSDQPSPTNISSPVEIASRVDARNLPCPMPLLKAKQALTGVAEGQCVEIMATDPASERDFHSFVELTPHRMIRFSHCAGVYTYVIQKACNTQKVEHS